MREYKSALFLAFSTLGRMLLAIYTIKVVAVNLGLSGTAIIGQFNTLLVVATMIAGGGISVGIANAVARRDLSYDERRRRLSSAYGYACVCTAAIVLLVVVFHKILAGWLLPIEYGAVLLIALAVAQLILFQIAAITALVNNQGRQDLYAKSSLASAVVSTVCVTLGCQHYGLLGSLVGILVGTISQWVFLLLLTQTQLPDLASLGRPIFVIADLRHWVHFTVLAIITIVGMPTVQIGVRNALAASAGWEIVGIWQAMVRVSDAYLQIILVLLGSFYLPKLAAADSLRGCVNILLTYCGRVLPVMVILCSGVYVLRFTIVPVLYSPKFLPVTDLFAPQLIGDFLKIASYLFSYTFLATGRYKLSMAVELLQAGIFAFLTMQFGIQNLALGVAWSYAGTYALYFLLIVFTFGVLVRQEKLRGTVGSQ